MKWQGGRESSNVSDAGGGFSGRGLAIGGGIGGLIIAVIVALLGGDPSRFLGQLGGPQQSADPNDPAYAEQVKFVKVILGSTEDVWNDQFQRMGRTYKEPHLELFRNEVETQGCGAADSGVGPFYCPADETVYLDPSFFQELADKFGAPGEFARAYVIAHEVGHHVQKLLGYNNRRVRGDDENMHSVRLELQADYLAGVWAHYGEEQRHFLEKGDLESAIHAAWEIGDDTLQSRFTHQVNPRRFTHGTSKQRTYWFKRGFETGSVKGAEELFTLPYDKL
jgi:predicted metalloprotease